MKWMPGLVLIPSNLVQMQVREYLSDKLFWNCWNPYEMLYNKLNPYTELPADYS